MGLFSSLCHGCGHPLLSTMAVDDDNAWMSLGLVIGPGGSVVSGVYTGYGAFEDPVSGVSTGPVLDQATVWHQDCWKVAGCPLEYLGESAYAPDQGWFFDDGAHSMAAPRTLADLPLLAEQDPGPVSPGDRASANEPTENPLTS